MGVVMGDDDDDGKRAVMADTLTPSEQALLAREVAADYYRHGHYNTGPRQAFSDGWDAALQWVEEQRIKSCTDEMEVEL